MEGVYRADVAWIVWVLLGNRLSPSCPFFQLVSQPGTDRSHGVSVFPGDKGSGGDPLDCLDRLIGHVDLQHLTATRQQFVRPKHEEPHPSGVSNLLDEFRSRSSLFLALVSPPVFFIVARHEEHIQVALLGFPKYLSP